MMMRDNNRPTQEGEMTLRDWLADVSDDEIISDGGTDWGRDSLIDALTDQLADLYDDSRGMALDEIGITSDDGLGWHRIDSRTGIRRSVPEYRIRAA